MSPPIADEIVRLVRSLFQERRLLARVRGQGDRLGILTRIAESSEVPPVQLSWLDEQVRHSSYAFYWSDAWHRLAPGAVSRLAQSLELDAAVTGLLASHANGFVRAAALEGLAQYTNGQEIPFFSLRANDWVEPVASRASELLISRLRPDNRQVVLNALPFIVRVLGQHRRDHSGIARALTSVLLFDRGEDALARGRQFDIVVRRKMYELLTAGGTAYERRILDAALRDPDAVIRARAIRFVATDSHVEDRPAILERFLRDDPVPAVRSLALTVLSEHLPERIAGVFPHVLLDRAVRVRGLARFVASTHQLPLVPRDVYVQALGGSVAGQLAAAIDGVGETGTRADADLIGPFLSEKSPRIRRSALGALANLDMERAISAAVAAFADDASSVRSTALDILTTNATRVDFNIVSRRIRSLSDPEARKDLLRVFLEAPKWDAPVFLLEALTDPDDAVRTVAARLVDRWIESFNSSQAQPTAQQLQRIDTLLDSVASLLPEETARMLRFSIKPSGATSN